MRCPQRPDLAEDHRRQLASVRAGRVAARAEAMVCLVYRVPDMVALGAQQSTDAGRRTGGRRRCARRVRMGGRFHGGIGVCRRGPKTNHTTSNDELMRGYEMKPKHLKTT